MMTLEQIEECLQDAAKNGTASDLNYWRGYKDATIRAMEDKENGTNTESK